jgi:hypothetical protein
VAGVVKIKRLADYCGTSVAMIEKHYARWMAEDTPAEIAGLGGTATSVADVEAPPAAVAAGSRLPRDELQRGPTAGNLTGNLSPSVEKNAASSEKD